ncbi:glycoside hydrolase family 101 beta sandwich domain-containing protein [Bacillus pacificus]
MLENVLSSLNGNGILDGHAYLIPFWVKQDFKKSNCWDSEKLYHWKFRRWCQTTLALPDEYKNATTVYVYKSDVIKVEQM